MTRFLRVGFLKEELERIAQLCSDLLEQPEIQTNSKLKDRVRGIADSAEKMKQFMEAFSSEPFIWTGKGETEEVISALEALVSAVESAGRVLGSSGPSWKG